MAGQERERACRGERCLELRERVRVEEAGCGQGIQSGSERELHEFRGAGFESGVDGELVFLRLKRAGGVEEPSTRAESMERIGEDFLLAGGVRSEGGGREAMADLRVAAEGPGAGAGDVGENQIEVQRGEGLGCIGLFTRDARGEWAWMGGHALA